MKQKRSWKIYKNEVILHHYEDITIDMDEITYLKKPLFNLIPPAGQFYNFEPVKGRVILSLMIGAAVVSGVSAILGYQYNQEYQNLIEEWETLGLGGQATEAQINDAYLKTDVCETIINVSLTTIGLVYCYAVADGFYSMGKLDGLFNSYTPAGK